MRPTEFTDEQIIAAGEALLADGKRVSGFAIRKKLGGGTQARFAAVWEAYVASKSVTMAEPVAELPIEVSQEIEQVTKALTDKLAMIARDINDKAVKVAERRVHEVVKAAGQQVSKFEIELVDAQEMIDDLEGQCDDYEKDIESLNKQLETSRSATQSTAVELAQMKERYGSLVLANKADHDNFTQEKSAWKQEKELLEQQIAELKQLNNAAKQNEVRLEERLNVSVQSEQSLKVQNTELQAQLLKEHEQLQEVTFQVRQNEKALAEKIEQLKLSNEELLAVKAQKIRVNEQYELAHRENNELREKVKKSDEDIQNWRDKCSKLEGVLEQMQKDGTVKANHV